ncbi:MAG: hypothetical protein AAGJ38_05130 [Planctomycetota bacterium]
MRELTPEVKRKLQKKTLTPVGVGCLLGLGCWGYFAITEPESWIIVLSLAVATILICAAVFVWMYRKNCDLYANGIFVNATVADQGGVRTQGLTKVNIEYEYEGKTYHRAFSGVLDQYEDDCLVEICIDPRKPERFVLAKELKV